MENGSNDRRLSFEEMRRRRSSTGSAERGGALFETEWEVFVARYDRNSGRYTLATYCCDDAATDRSRG